MNPGELMGGLALVMAVLGWAYQLGYQGAKVTRSTQDIKTLTEDLKLISDRMVKHHEDRGLHTGEEWREEVRTSLTRLESKIDALPCKRWPRAAECQIED